MKNFLKNLSKNWEVTGIILAFFIAVGYWGYDKFIRPNIIIQEVTKLPANEQIAQYRQWEAFHSFEKSHELSTYDKNERNPFDLHKTVFCLVTRLGDNYDYDYGTEEVILAKKCERYAEYENNRAKFIADKEAQELAQEKREQELENALDRLNEKSCN